MIVCLGTTPVYQRSMIFERLTPNDVNRAAAVYDYASGKSVNVARVLRTLGEEALATGFVGRGERGDALLANLDRAGIRHDFVRVEPSARQCITVIDRSSGTATELVEESQPVDARHWVELIEKLGGLTRAASACVFSGSLPPGGPEDLYARALRLSAGRRIPRIVDARKGPLRAALKEPAFVVKLNRDELAETVGGALDSDESLLRAMAAATPEHGVVVVTSGSRGAAVLSGGRAWWVRPPAVVARSAVGSGDAFAAGMTVGLLRGQEPHQAAALGAACGAANAMTDLAGHLSAKDVNELLAQVRMEPLQVRVAPL